MSSPAFKFLEGCATSNEIKNRINERFSSLYHHGNGKELLPFVCSVCDEFILQKSDLQIISLARMKRASSLLSWKTNFKDAERLPAVEEYYKFPSTAPGLSVRDRMWLDDMALSPRGSMHRVSQRNSLGFVSCLECKECLDKRGKPAMPLHAIANHNHVGCPPPELLELNDIERSFLTPIRAYGYFFTYEGGHMKQMKGSMTFMRVEEQKLAESITTLDCMGLTKHVIIMTNGPMTEQQQKKAKKMSEFRTDKMIAAVKWLCANHRLWKRVDINEIVDRIGRTNPIRVEKATTVKSGNATIEDEVVFTCYYPDGATNTVTGGFATPQEFKAFVEKMKTENYELQFKANMERTYVKHTSDGDHLVGACLLQFPYGVGSMDERRYLPDGKTTSKSDLAEFLHHLSRKADPLFQSSLFQLIMYSMKNKSRLLRSSALQLKQKFNAKTLAEGFDAADFQKACKGRRAKTRSGTNLSNKLLDAVDATARDLPHTDAAAKRARSSMESMFHHDGMGSVFLTVTFDDENSLLIQVLSGVEVDTGESIDDLSDEELAARAKKRQTIRYEFPGIAALNFEALLSILMEEVICWDVDNDCPIEGKKSLFGKVKAVAYAVEEQGRRTLHIHFILWIEGYHTLQQTMFFGSTAREKRDAKYVAQKYYDHLASTKLFPTSRTTLRKAFEHDGCTVSSKNRELPEVLCDQELRYLRHKDGYEALNGEFASCPHCDKKWTYEELITDYLTNVEDLHDKVTVTVPPSLTGDNDTLTQPKLRQLQRDRLVAKAVEYQHPSKTLLEEPTVCIQAAYQCHASCHHKNCFKCSKLTGKLKKEHICGKTCECRYRLPDRTRINTQVMTQHEGTAWYSWTGEKNLQPLLQFLPARNTYDLFQNVACEAISNSKFTCNSNVAVIMDGPVGMYACKYINKANEKDDTVEYAQVEAVMKKLSGEEEERKYDNDKSEALRILCRAAFAHNRTNIVSASMASFLTRHDSRFYFSRQFVFCPLKDVIRLHNQQDISGTVNLQSDGTSYFENQALHYLCRPDCLEEVNLKTFSEKWKVVYVPNKKDDTIIPMLADTGFYRHPSAKMKGRGKNKKVSCAQGVTERDDECYIKVPQWAFPDAETFRKNLLLCADDEMNRGMESQAQLILTLFLPHRCGEDLMHPNYANFPYLHKLREIHMEDIQRRLTGQKETLFTAEVEQFLQNVQNSAYNCTRYKSGYDDLAHDTDPFEGKDSDISALTQHELEEEDNTPNTGYEEFLQCLEGELNRPLHDEDPQLFFHFMDNFTFGHIRDSGDDRCGHRKDMSLPDLIPRGGGDEAFVHTVQTGNNTRRRRRRTRRTDEHRKTYSVKEITAVLLQRSTKSHRNVWKGKDINVEKATGSIRSIREWSKAGFGTDRKQQRAFEAIISAFLLTFYDDDGRPVSDDNNNAITQEEKRHFRRNRNALLKLKGNPRNAQMICLLHGPGGSGKSTVINMTTAYAKSFCETLNHPFDNRTITLTAMSGVAATLLRGETTHTALSMNGKISNEKIEEFLDCRLVIIDEISFASVPSIQRIHECLKILMGKNYRQYGGVNVVFAGDFSQLDPVRCPQKLFEVKDVPEWHHALNCFIELNGTHRFKDDPFWGEVLRRFRDGNPTHQDIDLINNHCHVSVRPPPKNVPVATRINKNRDAINSAIFEDWCEEHKPQDGSVLQEACVILMDDLQMSTSNGAFVQVTSNQVRKFFYENCGENDCKMPENSKGRVDPILKLYPGCPVMLTQNHDVPAGQANGSRLFLEQVRIRPGEQPFPLKLDCGTRINALFASQVEGIILRHENDDIQPQVFQMQSQAWSFSTKLEIGSITMKVSMKGEQFPIISNSCTTGHKLQGCSLDEVLVNDWCYSQNWAYVVLSRVRTMQGLYIREELTHDLKKYKKSEKMTDMLKTFRANILLNDLTDQEYDTMIEDTDYNAP